MLQIELDTNPLGLFPKSFYIMSRSSSCRFEIVSFEPLAMFMHVIVIATYISTHQCSCSLDSFESILRYTRAAETVEYFLISLRGSKPLYTCGVKAKDIPTHSERKASRRFIVGFFIGRYSLLCNLCK